MSSYKILQLFPHKGAIQVCLPTKHSHCSCTKNQFRCVFLHNTPIVPTQRTSSGVFFYIILPLFPATQPRCNHGTGVGWGPRRPPGAGGQRGRTGKDRRQSRTLSLVLCLLARAALSLKHRTTIVRMRMKGVCVVVVVVVIIIIIITIIIISSSNNSNFFLLFLLFLMLLLSLSISLI